jgi:hypothetical protein
VPGIWTEPDRAVKVQMLEEGLPRWRVGQPLFGIGALLAALGVGFLAADSASPEQSWFVVSGALLFVGAVAWSWSVLLRGVHPREFALGELPGWPFALYIWLTIAGLAPLGVGLVLSDQPDWTGWLTLGLDALFLATYLRYRDIPPFVFYLLLLVIGVVVL